MSLIVWNIFHEYILTTETIRWCWVDSWLFKYFVSVSEMFCCRIGWKEGRISFGLFLDKHSNLSRQLRKRYVKHHMRNPETWSVSNPILLDFSSRSLPQHQPDRLRVVGNDGGHADANPLNLLGHFSSGRVKCRMLWTYMASHFALWLKHRFFSNWVVLREICVWSSFHTGLSLLMSRILSVLSFVTPK
jgi:hypothetical protein